ncbi:unnamed protein product [Arabidopsis thaliana]|uniref:Uncharacterized protein n=1 Tax=Arabidopsis thaliana TaxID=3702 RepID=A0A654EFQ4_ARATH|nr:unnamed protein product [Arabidopsis thaliana]
MEGEHDSDGGEDDTRDEIETAPEITLHALTGLDTPTTLRLRAGIGSRHVLALVDSGSTHNFISVKAAQKLRLHKNNLPPFLV